MSKLLTASGEDEYIQLSEMRCTECNKSLADVVDPPKDTKGKPKK